MRVLVCGGRDFNDWPLLNQALSDLLPEDTRDTVTIISGHARGADALGERWARAEGLQLLVFPADWQTYGRSAGPIRNKQMLVEGKPELVVAFAGGSGTANMIKQARAAGVTVVEVE
jgi:YspA, cpYpsA-related SLOG family